MDGFDANFEHPLNKALIDTMVKAFKNTDGAYNYLTLAVNHESEKYEFTITKKNGKSIADINLELKIENALLKKRLNEEHDPH